MRYLFGFLCVCALGVMPLVGCSGTGGSNSFEIIRDGRNQSYDTTSIKLREEESQLLLYASSSSGDPSIADDDRWYYLWVVFEADGLAVLATGLDYPISGESSWTDSDWLGGARPEQVTFVGTEIHTAAIEKVFFGHCYAGCWVEPGGGAQTIRGTLSLTVNEAPRLAGVIKVRVEGDVPGADGTYDLTLRFDQSVSTDADAGVDAATDAGTDASTDADAGTDIDAGTDAAAARDSAPTYAGRTEPERL